jgi:hypothetical protein
MSKFFTGLANALDGMYALGITGILDALLILWIEIVFTRNAFA